MSSSVSEDREAEAKDGRRSESEVDEVRIAKWGHRLRPRYGGARRELRGYFLTFGFRGSAHGVDLSLQGWISEASHRCYEQRINEGPFRFRFTLCR